MSAVKSAAFSLDSIVNSINLGLIVVDSGKNILLWNDWVSKYSGIAAESAIGHKISGVFKEAPSPAFLAALKNTLAYGLPAVLSNALHRSPLALYPDSDTAPEQARMHQSITLSPLSSPDNKRCCLIQISDSSNSIKREKMLRSHSEILKREATTDSLTGIYNRRFFDEHYKIASGQSIRQKLPLSVLMVDIDFFKEYNDYYGHPAGDKTLIKVAHMLKTQLSRSSDVLARYGGEEFILALPNMPEQHAIAFANRLKTSIWEMAIPHLKSKIGTQLSISIGICTYDQMQHADVATLIQNADNALYQAKQHGRNQVCFMPPTPLAAPQG